MSHTHTPDRYAAFLAEVGACDTGHTGRSLFDHLQGTCELLQAWRADEDVAVAGLFHSIYGTTAFKKQLLLASQDRPRLRELIGVRAEALVHLFSAELRPAAFARRGGFPAGYVDALQSAGVEPADAAQMMQALVEIECANLVEQSAYHGSGFQHCLDSARRQRQLVLREPVAAALPPAPAA